jgi:hypothetical protein
LYAYKIFSFNTLALDATVVIAITFLGTTIAGTIMPWRAKDVFDGSPIAKYKMPAWLSWLVTLVYAVFAVYLIVVSIQYAWTIISGIGTLNPDGLTWFVVIVLGLLTLVNAGILVWIVYYIGDKVLRGAQMPLITMAGLIFLGFLDWLLVEWFWDPHVLPSALPAVGTYAIGWSNVSSMVFMFLNYIVAAAIYFGFSAYRRNQGIDVEKIYKAIPVE